ncbi:Kelch-like protein 10 [Toxocara canis]|uniref:Kelch-like protein 10 n=1 Tax=Toxocara canis TaxID=6265 RepID=A0A0B2USY4_TOXCA|nr:Kelch-like protein 10 [Toxocara canis]
MVASAGNYGETDTNYDATTVVNRIDAQLDALHDCTVSANNHAELKVSKRLIVHRCSALIPLIRYKNERKDHWILKTTADYEILKDILHFLQYGCIETDDWLRLENILDQCRQWKLREIEKYILYRFIGEINEENCLSVWLMCKNSLPDQLTKIFDYLLYIINDSVNNNKNLEFYRLDMAHLCEILNSDMLNIKEEIFDYLLYIINDSVNNNKNLEFYRLDMAHLCEILNSDMLNIKEEMDVWKLIKKWILIDKRKRELQLQPLLQCLRYNLLTEKEKDEVKDDLVRMKFIANHFCAFQHNDTNNPRMARDLILALCGWEWLGPSNRIEVFDAVEHRWKRVPSMEDKRKISYHGCVVIDQKIYMIGGFDGSDCFNTMRCYDGETRQWTELAPMHYPRCYIAACEINGLIVAVGGSDGHFRLRAAEIYNPEKNQWTTIRNMNQRRSDAAACSMAGRVFVAGGFTGDIVLQSVEMYSPEKDIWIEVANMNSPRSGLACVAADNYIIFAGGFDGNNRLNTVEMLRLGSAHTTPMPPMPFARSNFDLCKLGSKFYAIGGYTTCLTRHVLCFDGHQWDFSHDLCVGRSALRVIVLRGWPDPRWILNDEEDSVRSATTLNTAKKSIDQMAIVHSEG